MWRNTPNRKCRSYLFTFKEKERNMQTMKKEVEKWRLKEWRQKKSTFGDGKDITPGR